MLALYMTLLEEERDREAFFHIYQKHYNKMMQVARRYFPGDEAGAEDAVHDSFLKIIENFSKISALPCEELEPYIVIIVKNVSINTLRKKKRLVLTDDWASYETAGDREPGDGYGHILDIIQSMPETYRAVLTQRFVDEMEYREIAQDLGMTETAVASRISRGRKLLVEKLTEEGITP